MHYIYALSQMPGKFAHSKNKNCFWNFHNERKHRPTLCKPALIRSLGNIFVVLEITWGWGYVLRLRLG